MVKIEGKGGISATVVADSISPAGKRITTFELEYPRFIHSEFMTHRLFSRNAASSRAIPVKKMIDHVMNNMAMPIHWGANQQGMQAENELDEATKAFVKESWESIGAVSAGFAEGLAGANAHKQIVNRILEPYQFIKVVCTATEYDNWFWLRNHKDAQPEIKELAACMYEALLVSEADHLHDGEWHLPYVGRGWENGEIDYVIEDGDGCLQSLSLVDAIKVSASCCAQVSYRLTDNSLDKALKIYDMLVESKPVHASPFEHQATPMNRKVGLDTEGVTGYNNKLGYVSGNFSGWIQNRQLIHDNTCWDYEPE